MNNSKIRDILFYVILLLLLSACSNLTIADETSTPALEKLEDLSILTGIPCSAPCWYGLEVGFSNREDVFNVIEEVGFLDPNSTHEASASYYDPELGERVPSDSIDVDCINSTLTNCVYFDLVENKLVGILVLHVIDFTVEEIVEKLGEPDYISSWLYGEVVHCQIDITWEKYQVTVGHDVSDFDQAIYLCEEIPSGLKIDPDLIVQSVNYFSSEWNEVLPKLGQDYPWPGFEE